jgi:hypothetical protein
MSTSTPVADNKAMAGGSPLTAPEEKFWKHYSPHHEFPLSAVTSVALHVLALILLALAAYFVADLIKKRNKPLAEEALTIASGGGGSKSGEGDGPGGAEGGGGDEDPKEDVPNKDGDKTDPTDPNREKLKPGEVPVKSLPEIKDPDISRLINSGHVSAKNAAGMSDKLLKGMKKGKGEGGPGRDGGKDRGKDKGKGRGEGEGDGDLERIKRVLRWTMIFDTYSGDDYRRQLAGLHAFLAVPKPPDGREYGFIAEDELTPKPRRIEDLKNTVTIGDKEYSLETIPNIRWTDSKADSVAALSRALALDQVPPHIVAFFPADLEVKLLKLELQYKGLKEDQIYETRFKIRKIGGGQYEPVVISQTPKR